MNPSRRQFLNASGAGVCLWLICALCFQLYSPAFPAPWMYDDAPNLHQLGSVGDAGSALGFVLGGVSSALGRPLSLASFLVNAPDWPSAPEAFRRVNILLHLLNGLLVCWLVLKLARGTGRMPETSAQWLAVVVAALWLLHPLLASTSLLVVQRMTLLAACITLLGLLAFVHGRQQLQARPVVGYAWMSLGVGLGALLGTLAKENAALLPFFAASLSFTVLAGVPVDSKLRWRSWCALFFGGPTLLLLGYIAVAWPDIAAGYDHRAFGLGQRLWTQPVVLWEYVRQVLLPDTSVMGPFHDGYPAQPGPTPAAVAALAAWAFVVIAALWLRRAAPVLSLAVLWFLSGHLLESTVFNLELYFEHRNYLPAVGLLAAPVVLAWTAPYRWTRYAAAGAVPVAALLLWQVTSLWSQPLLAAERWAAEHPQSSRALQYLAQRYVLRGDEFTGMRVIRRAAKQNPRASDLAIQNLQMQCGFVDEAAYRALFRKTLERVDQLESSLAVADATNKLRQMVAAGDCPGLEMADVTLLLKALLSNERLESYALLRHHLHHQLAEIHTRARNLDGAVRNLQAAFSARPNPGTAELLVATLASAGLLDDARAAMENAMAHAPRLAVQRRHWRQRFEEMSQALGLPE